MSILSDLETKVISGGDITGDEAILLTSAPLHSLFDAASSIREHFRGSSVDLCSIVNAKSGACQEDCLYCAQSSRYKTDIRQYPLLKRDEILQKAKEAGASGAKRFCIVTSGRKVSSNELKEITASIEAIRDAGILPCATIGLLNREELQLLKDAGLERFHHNLESSEEFFSRVCSTHSYRDKLATIEAVKSVGLSLCSGGIFGMGEAWEDRIEMALKLREVDVDSVPVNFLMPIKGTPLGDRKTLNPVEALRIVSLLRFMLPGKEIRLCGGRLQTLGEFNSMVFLAGADGLLIGNYLTREGRTTEDDLKMIKAYGLQYT